MEAVPVSLKARAGSSSLTRTSAPTPCSIAVHESRPQHLTLVPRELDGFHRDLRLLPFARDHREVAPLLPPFGQQEHIAGDLTHACPLLHGFMMILRLSPCCLLRRYLSISLLLSRLQVHVLEQC